MFQFTQTVQLVSESGDGGAEAATPQLGRVTNPQVAEVLYNIATLLEMQQANPYRVAAYRNAATRLMALPESVAAIIARGARLEVPGIGDRLRRKITELVTTGRMTFYDDLCEESLPEDVRALMAVPHVGPRTALRLSGQIGIHSVAELWQAAQAQRLRPYYRFGPRSEQRLAEGALAIMRAQHAVRFAGDGAAPAPTQLVPVLTAQALPAASVAPPALPIALPAA